MKALTLSPSQVKLFRQGLAEFNQQDYYACHESLETLWMQDSGSRKLWLQGLIQIAVACYHASQQNYKGAFSLMQAGYQKLSAYPQNWIDTHSLRVQIQSYLPELSRWQVQTPSKAYCDFRLDLCPSI